MSPQFSDREPGQMVLPCQRGADKKHWIEIELLFEDETPVAGERYHIQLTDGSEHDGRLDKNGRARYDNIDAGICHVAFPDMDGMDWDGKSTAGPDHSEPDEAPRKTWIGVCLLDEIGVPVAGERFELKLPDGSVQKGVLDKYGSVYYGNIDPGACELCFPDLPAEDWS